MEYVASIFRVEVLFLIWEFTRVNHPYNEASKQARKQPTNQLTNQTTNQPTNQTKNKQTYQPNNKRFTKHGILCNEF
jgi:hypothetical protein